MTMTSQIQTSEKRDKILQRVLNLRARAEDSGSSEAEMNTALTMAAKLMDAYNVEEAELALAESEGRIELEIVKKNADASALKGKKHKHSVLSTLTAIAKFTETRVVFSSYTGEITYTGHRPDTELANFLTSVIREALDREYDNYRRNTPAVGYGAKASFTSAMAARISSRLYKMAEERAAEREENKKEAERLKIENGATASSTALVVSEIAEQKAKEVDAEFRKAYPNLRTVRTMTTSRNYTAHGAGSAAGNKVNLGKAISQSSRKAIA